MKSRSEALKEKRAKKSSEAKPSAEARTVPLPAAFPNAVATCGECGKESKASECSTRADGFAECPSCGAPVALSAPKDPIDVEIERAQEAVREKPKDAVDRVIEKRKAEKDAKAAPSEGMQKLLDEKKAKEPPAPAPMFCGECGVDLSWVTVGMSTWMYPCGHSKEKHGMVDDPRKAKAPETKVAGPGHRRDLEIERRNAEDAKRGFTPPSGPAEPKPAFFGPGPATLFGNRLSIPWGEARMAVDQWNNFKCGGHIITVEVPEGADRVEVAEKVIDDLEKIAERLFRRQKAWYEKKLGILSGDSK